MYWNYRIVRHAGGCLVVHEVDYNDDGSIICIADALIMASDVENLHKVIEMISKDINHNPEILEYNDYRPHRKRPVSFVENSVDKCDNSAE